MNFFHPISYHVLTSFQTPMIMALNSIPAPIWNCSLSVQGALSTEHLSLCPWYPARADVKEPVADLVRTWQTALEGEEMPVLLLSGTGGVERRIELPDMPEIQLLSC